MEEEQEEEVDVPLASALTEAAEEAPPFRDASCDVADDAADAYPNPASTAAPEVVRRRTTDEVCLLDLEDSALPKVALRRYRDVRPSHHA